MSEDTKLEERMRFVELVNRLKELDEAGFEEMYKLGAFRLGVIDRSYFNDITDLPEHLAKELIELYLNERAYAVDGDYESADKYKNAQTQILQKRELVSILVGVLNYVMETRPNVIYLPPLAKYDSLTVSPPLS